MRKINMTKLNNKGFTLIELLAVIVILAVVMGVASTQVLSAMNNSRKSSLQNSALSAADAFRTAYAEASLTNATSILGVSIPNSAGSGKATLNQTAADKLNISSNNYNLSASFVYFDFTNSKVDVCLVANTNGSYYVQDASADKGTKKNTTTGLGSNTITSGMWACSNNRNSWS